MTTASLVHFRKQSASKAMFSSEFLHLLQHYSQNFVMAGGRECLKELLRQTFGLSHGEGGVFLVGKEREISDKYRAEN